MKPHFLRAILLIAVLAVTASAACVVRSRPAHSRHTVHHNDQDNRPGKHKKPKKHKKAKKHK